MLPLEVQFCWAGSFGAQRLELLHALSWYHGSLQQQVASQATAGSVISKLSSRLYHPQAAALGLVLVTAIRLPKDLSCLFRSGPQP